MTKTSYDKLNISLRYWLLGMAQVNKEYYDCIKAMEFAKGFHTGLRKDDADRIHNIQSMVGVFTQINKEVT